MRRVSSALILASAALLAGCVVRTAAHVATVPVRAVGKGVDWATTSRDEADRNRGRAMRRQEKREARERRKEEKDARRRQSEASGYP